MENDEYLEPMFGLLRLNFLDTLICKIALTYFFQMAQRDHFFSVHAALLRSTLFWKIKPFEVRRTCILCVLKQTNPGNHSPLAALIVSQAWQRKKLIPCQALSGCSR